MRVFASLGTSEQNVVKVIPSSLVQGTVPAPAIMHMAPVAYTTAAPQYTIAQVTSAVHTFT